MIKVEDHIGMVGFVIKKYKFKPPAGYTSKDMFQVGCVGLVKATKTFDQSKTSGGFGGQAYRYIKYELMELVRKQKWDNRKVDKVTMSYDVPALNEPEVLYKDLFAGVENTEKVAILNLVFEELNNYFEEDESIIITLKMLIAGYEQKEIAEVLGLSTMSVRRRIYKIRDKLKEMLE